MSIISEIVALLDVDAEKIRRLHGAVVYESEAEGPYRLVVQLIKIEHAFHRGDFELIDALFKTIKPNDLKAVKTGTHMEAYIKIKYYDLLSDFQYLVADCDLSKFVDLINKKILAINSITETAEIGELIRTVNEKILHLFIVASYDFRRYNVVNYLTTHLHDIDDDVSREIFDHITHNRIVPTALFRQFVTGETRYKAVFERLGFEALLPNLVENNLVELSKYYRSIKIPRIYQLLDLSDFRLDPVLLDMIIKNKFSTGTKIDHAKSLLVFGEENEEVKNDLNTFTRDVGTLINDIHLYITR